jgi:copper chaperone CopZ
MSFRQASTLFVPSAHPRAFSTAVGFTDNAYLILRRHTEAKIADIEEKIKALAGMRQALEKLAAACAVTVKKNLIRVDGVKDAKVTSNPPQAVVTYDPAKIRVERPVEATSKAGFPSTVVPQGGKR